jgi:hypothetical protein
MRVSAHPCESVVVHLKYICTIRWKRPMLSRSIVRIMSIPSRKPVAVDRALLDSQARTDYTASVIGSMQESGITFVSPGTYFLRLPLKDFNGSSLLPVAFPLFPLPRWCILALRSLFSPILPTPTKPTSFAVSPFRPLTGIK